MVGKKYNRLRMCKLCGMLSTETVDEKKSFFSFYKRERGARSVSNKKTLK